ncbi:hypothetical protein [Caulobacter sp. RHG1]|uniref:hypothetical protein n=1 Tax=Caulobacter sp. (strain RHG1) TaxID=2545762 RepID=UPI001F5126E6|nr:hypothetical protein [Caulobacter sp. RHG1]NQE63314.1 hypothetical protein [Caulobacter sp. RHG1]
MRTWTPMLVAAGLLALSACASPRAIGEGDVTVLQGATVGAPASPAEDAFAQAVQAEAISRLGAQVGARPDFLIQVGVSLAPSTMGVSTAAAENASPTWRSPIPPIRPWNRKGPVRAVTLAVLDAKTGKTLAWSSVRARKETPAVVADLLVKALRLTAKAA